MLALSQCPGIDPTGKDSTAALQAALNLKQPLMWDCPVTALMGSDAAKGIFVPDGSDVTFTPRGLFNVDAAGFPALCFYHSSGTWRGLKMRYQGAYGVISPQSGHRWNDAILRQYLSAHGIHAFAVGANPFWAGSTNTSALLGIYGSSNVTFAGGKITVDPDVPAAAFAPVGVALGLAFPAGPVTLSSWPGPMLAATVTMTDFDFDGVLMGVVGGPAKASFTRITRYRYADLQDAAGANVGGIGQWFAPPHLFYLFGSVANPMTATLKDIVDLGQFVGNPLRRTVGSGYMNSIKLELANGSSIDGYYSRCLDGGMGVLANGATVGGSVKNAYFLADSTIKDLNGRPASTGGLWFPSPGPYPPSQIDVTIQSVTPNTWPLMQAIPAPIALKLQLGYGL